MDTESSMQIVATLIAMLVPWCAALSTVMMIGFLRRLAIRFALKRAWKEDSLSLLILKYLGPKTTTLDTFEVQSRFYFRPRPNMVPLLTVVSILTVCLVSAGRHAVVAGAPAETHPCTLVGFASAHPRRRCYGRSTGSGRCAVCNLILLILQACSLSACA